MSIPDTRPSLLVRLRDPQDRDAWEEFVSIYQHIVHRMATRRGLQKADADDLTQQVLWAISRTIDRFEPDQERGKFRTWLRTIAHRAIVNAISRRHADQALGGDDAQILLTELSQVDASDELLHHEYRQELFLVAAAQVRAEVSEQAWHSFWETNVRGRSVAEVARELNWTPGNIYTWRCRIMKRLKAKVQWLDIEEVLP